MSCQRYGKFQKRFKITFATQNMSAVGFEPTRIAPPELESGALDRSAKLTHGNMYKLLSKSSNSSLSRPKSTSWQDRTADLLRVKQAS
jgi:hypothetical protein